MRFGTWNMPPHSGTPAQYREDVAQLARQHRAEIVAVQERPDDQVASLCPPGWASYRPGKAQSAAVLWDASAWDLLEHGTFKVSSKGDPISPRFIVWVKVQRRDGSQTVTVGSVHLLAGKTENDKRGREFEHQTARCAAWVQKGRRVLLGDFNAEPGTRWLAPLDDVARHHTNPPNTGPKGTPIDLAWVWRKGKWAAPQTVGTMGGHSDHKALIVSVRKT